MLAERRKIVSSPLLEMRDIRKYFPVHRGFLRRVVGWVKAVDGVSIDIHAQEVHALVGESGSGKSTLGRLALRLLDLTAGEIYFKGERIDQIPIKEFKPYRKSLQMIFQDPFASLNPRYTIEESLGEGLIYHQLVKSESEKKERIAAVLKEVGLSSDAMKRYPHQFSGGQQQRICIGRAIAMQPKLIVCDEAVSALDVSVQAQVLNLLARLQEEFQLSYLFIAHDLSVVRHISDRVTVMYLGKVMETGPSAEIFAEPKHPYTQALLSSIPEAKLAKREKPMSLKGEIPSPLNPPSGCPFRTRCPFAKPICAEPPPKKHGKGKDHSYWCILD
jgi:peptide/nickel transport system ATP-binding protein/oligopeptide transport system ATP-binding protein